MKSLLVSIAVFLVLCGTLAFAAWMYLTGQTPQGAAGDIYDVGRLSLYRYGLLDRLTSAETVRLYRDACTRKCHGREVIEKNLRTAAEWEAVMARMKAPDRAGIADRHAEAITHYLQNNFLSNVPTVLPEKTMKFVKLHLWRSDFGESDLFLDMIYIPPEHYSLLPYLGVRNASLDRRAISFVVYINTHQGIIPPWNFAELATIRGGGAPRKAVRWEVLYRDGQQHHNQGILAFDGADAGKMTEMEIEMRLPGLGARTFQWNLPVPPLQE